MPEYIKYAANAFAILFIIITLIIGLIFRKNRYEKGSEDLFKVVYVMLITSTVMIYISIMLLYF